MKNSSYYFVVNIDGKSKYVLALFSETKNNEIFFEYSGMSTTDSKQKNFNYTSKVPGIISEKAALEIIDMQVDTASKIVEEKNLKYLFFNNKKYEIQAYEKVKEEIMLIFKEQIFKN